MADAGGPDVARPESFVKTIVVTGVTRGLGRAMLEEFDRLGHRVIGCSRSKSAIEALRQSFPAPHYLDDVDVSDDHQVHFWARHVLAEFDTPDMIVNNAGLMNTIGPVWSVSAEEFRKVMATNVDGIANMARHFLPAMIRRGYGVMVNFSSGWGRTADAGVAPYCASKWGVEGLTQAMAQEVPPGLCIAALNPGIINTEMLRGCWPGSAPGVDTTAVWAKRVVPWLLALSPLENGQSLTAPGASS
jgi:NAD(P)-dependent dehydrogenase (short-subunit alcohol dehydrogenase family)